MRALVSYLSGTPPTFDGLMIARPVALAAAIILAFSPPAAAQGTPGSGVIHGRVVNGATKTPIGLATVEVTDSAATAPAARTSTGDDGSFIVQGLAPGRYRVRI